MNTCEQCGCEMPEWKYLYCDHCDGSIPDELDNPLNDALEGFTYGA